MLWQGSPFDFSSSVLSRYLRKSRSEAQVSDLFHFKEDVFNDAEKEYVPKNDFELKKSQKGVLQIFKLKKINCIQN